MKRRNFIKNSVVASASLMLPSFIKAMNHPFGATTSLSSTNGKRLVVIQLSGGNDGLNTIIPYRNDIYYRSRPTIGIQRKQALRLTDDLGFNPVLAPLKNLFEDGLMSIINSVGYPNPSRSHFRSMDIWQSGSGSNQYWQSGWLGRYLDNNCNDCTAHHSLEIDDSLSLALKGNDNNGFAMNNPNLLKKSVQGKFLTSIANDHDHDENVAYLYKTLTDTQSSAQYLFEKSKTFKSNIQYPNHGFGKKLKLISELITADSDTQIYYVSLGGFDTHAFQNNKQNKLLKTYADAVAAFVKDLKSNQLLDDTLIMTFSEFGRRVQQNGSNGTDHGTANNVFMMGGNLKKPGFYNEAPNLLNLDNGDLKYEVDFRQIYATVLEKWLGTNHRGILGDEFKLLGMV